MTILTIIGITGALVGLSAFLFMQFHYWKSNYLIYQFFNVIAGVSLCYYAITTRSYLFAVTNSIWGSVALYYCWKDFQRNSHRHANVLHRRTFFQKWME